MTPTDLELRRMVAERMGWTFCPSIHGSGDAWVSPDGRTHNKPPELSHWAWPCLLELAQTQSYQFQFNGVYYYCGMFKDKDPARAVVLAWLKFKGGPNEK